MAAYQIECRMVRIGATRFTVTLAVVPADGRRELYGLSRAPEFMLMEASDDPFAARARLVEDLKSELSDLGHDIVLVRNA